MATSYLIFAVLAIDAAIAQELSGCDDCCSPQIDFVCGNVFMNGMEYGAYSVSSNGYILLLPTNSSPITPYSYAPSPISQVIGSPMIAPYWDDISLTCSGSTNAVRFSETSNTVVLSYARRCVGDSNFYPDFAVVVIYDAVQEYTCSGSGTNSFEILIATDNYSQRSYAIYLYHTMEWNRYSPTVGYSTGQGAGDQYTLGEDPASDLSDRTLTYRLDQTNSANEAVWESKVNKGNLIYLQQTDKGASTQHGGKIKSHQFVFLQQTGKNNGRSDSKVTEKQASMLSQQRHKETMQKELRVALQEWEDKNLQE